MMKKVIILMIALLLPMLASADYAYIDGISYFLLSSNSGDNSASVQSSNPKYSGDVVIPSQVTYNGQTYSVTTIGDWAFYNCIDLTSVTIPNSVTTIRDYAFYGCTGLTSVIIPNSVTTIGQNSFAGCSGLVSLSIPNSVKTIGLKAFDETAWLNNQPDGLVYAGKVAYKYKGEMPDNTIISIIEGTLGIAADAFDGCQGLTSVIIPNSVTIIGDLAFYDCDGLTSVSIPNSVTSIGEKTFAGCSNMASVSIGSGVSAIEDNAFSGCNNLTAVHITDLSAWCNIGFSSESVTRCGNPLLMAHHLFLNGIEITELKIPKSISRIMNYTFCGCSGLNSVRIPNNVTSIGYCAFRDCHSLSSVILEMDNPFRIDERTFSSSDNTKDIYTTATLTVPAGTKSLYQSTAGWNKFQNIVEASGGGEIGQVFESGGIYYKIGENNTVEVSSGDVTYSGDIFIPSQVIYNGITYNVVSIGEWAFCYCIGLTSVTIPNSVTSIGNVAFSGCSSLSSVTIPNSVIYIGESAFYNCSGLTSVTIPNGVTTIGDGVFYGCSSLLSVTIPNGVITIGDGAFKGCSGLTSITIPPNVTNIGKSAFSGCSSLTSIAIPSSVSYIDEAAFSHCSGLTAVYITDIAAWCNITFRSDLGTNPLYYAHHLYMNGKEIKDLIIPQSVNSIRNCVFMGCSGLTSVTIPNSVTSINGYAFRDCSGLTSIVSEIKNPYEIGDDVFYSNVKNVYATATLTVPAGTKSLYQSTAGWNKFQNIVEARAENEDIIQFEDAEVKRICVENWDTNGDGELSKTEAAAVKSFGIGRFANNKEIKSFNELEYFTSLTGIGQVTFFLSGLTSISIPKSVKTIGEQAFYGCPLTSVYISDLEAWCNISYSDEMDGDRSSNPMGYAQHLYLNGVEIKDLYVPNSVTSIYYGAFDGCNNLNTVFIPSGVSRIGERAFSCCSGLSSIIVETGNPKYDSRNNCNAIIETESNTLIAGCKNTTIPNGVTSIGRFAFSGCKDLSFVTIPNTVTSIERSAFYNCSGLSSITIPKSTTSIGKNAFQKCSGLTTIVSEIKNPFEISENVFGSDTYATATLTVPAGTKSLYQSTAGWNKFQNIVEAEAEQNLFEESGITYLGTVSTQTAKVQSVSGELKNVVIPESVYYNGKTYQVTAVDDQAFTGLDVNYISFPSSVNSVTDKTFSRCNMGALVWSAEATLPGNTFSNASMGTDANFLLYVKSASYAPSTVKNVVVNGTASSVLLSDDGGKFYCPEQFKAGSISYTHYYNMETGGGKGWETLALPFDVQKISHSTRGEIVPFAAYRTGSSQKPFWLANYTVSGFKRTSAIQANEPYIISMPNNSNYNNDYNLAGGVTFSSENIIVPKTPNFNGTFLPAFDTVSKSSSVMALNVNNRNVSYTGNYEAGSRFISNLRDVRPYEAYMISNSTRGVYVINTDGGTTDMDDMLLIGDDDVEITIYSLSGQLVERTNKSGFDAVWQQLPKGVYVVDGKKWVK